MYKCYLILLLSLLQVNLLGQGDLVVEVSGIKALQGTLYISLYDRESVYMKIDSAFRKVMVPVNSERLTAVLTGVPEGDYAIAIYQDQNGNGIMDVTEMQIPKEPFGFSNNTKGIRGPATFQQALFRFNGKDPVKIELVNNLFTPNKEKSEKPR
jgi:uncharacterized protein (DUF2141 family)